MDRKPKDVTKSHFHIYWNRKNQFDWEIFDSRHGAATRALELAMVGETFEIRKCFADCSVAKSRISSARYLTEFESAGQGKQY
jgi:hypothetical protein